LHQKVLSAGGLTEKSLNETIRKLLRRRNSEESRGRDDCNKSRRFWEGDTTHNRPIKKKPLKNILAGKKHREVKNGRREQRTIRKRLITFGEMWGGYPRWEEEFDVSGKGA